MLCPSWEVQIKRNYLSVLQWHQSSINVVINVLNDNMSMYCEWETDIICQSLHAVVLQINHTYSPEIMVTFARGAGGFRSYEERGERDSNRKFRHRLKCIMWNGVSWTSPLFIALSSYIHVYKVMFHLSISPALVPIHIDQMYTSPNSL